MSAISDIREKNLSTWTNVEKCFAELWEQNGFKDMAEEAASNYATMQARIKDLEKENSVMYAAILEASELGNSAALRCKVELQRIARNEAK